MCRKNVLIERAQNFVRRGIQAEKALAGGVTPKFRLDGVGQRARSRITELPGNSAYSVGSGNWGQKLGCGELSLVDIRSG